MKKIAIVGVLMAVVEMIWLLSPLISNQLVDKTTLKQIPEQQTVVVKPNSKNEEEVQKNETFVEPTKKIYFSVPFTSQSPFNEWSDPRQQDACEEAAVLMAMKWVRDEKIASLAGAKKELMDIVGFETEKFGSYHDTSSKDTIESIFKSYYKYDQVEYIQNVKIEDIIQALQEGKLVITPMNGQVLKNPHYTNRGPERHMILIIGYDPKTKEFITNDAGTTWGKDYRYKTDLFWNAIRDYPTGNHETIVGELKNGIVVSRISKN